MANVKITDLTEDAAPALENLIETVDDPSGTPASRYSTMAKTLALLGVEPGGRLTLTTAVPVTTSDVTAATTLYYTPYKHNFVRLYNASDSAWELHTFTERSISIPATTDTNYDVFLYDNSGTLTLELVAWTNATTRATAITRQDGSYVKSGDASRLYLGTIRTTGTSGQCEDSFAKRYVWNYYNRVRRGMAAVDATVSWSYGTNTWRAANNDTGNRVEFVVGVSEDLVAASLVCTTAHDASEQGSVGIGLDSTSSPSGAYTEGSQGAGGATLELPNNAQYSGYPGIGYHYLQWLEIVRAGTVFFFGTHNTANAKSQLSAMIEG